VPTTLGYYDLLDPNTRARQADLARAHGITGFCYYHYWFHGKRILEKPLDALLASGTPDFPFCVFWANESWQKTWDGGNQEILMRQEHDALDDMAFIRHLLPMFNDKRYIRVRGQPLLMVYRVDNLPAAAETFERWREACIRHHELPPFIVVADTRYEGSALAFGADASVGFPPHRLSAQAMRASDIASDPSFSGNLLDYRSVAATLATQTESDHLRFQCVVPRWDNTARRQFDGTVFAHSSPQRFEAWLRDALVRARDDLPAGQRFVFINAWNEWAEGAYLEPDAHFGDAYLKAALRARHVPIGYRRIGQATK
jgi:lipopolysaccharide biosynthesis protein